MHGDGVSHGGAFNPQQHSSLHQQDQQSPDDASMRTITPSSGQQVPENHNPGYGNPQSSYDPRPQTSYSDTGFSRPYHSKPAEHHPNYQSFSPPPEVDPSTRYNSPRMDYQQHSASSNSRPSSGQAGEKQGYAAAEIANRSSAYQDQNQRPAQSQPAAKNTSVVIKVGMVGDAQIGKTSLMVKYVEGSWDEDYIQTLGVNFMEKTISIRNTEITFSIWDLGGQREFVNMLPLVCNDAVAILFMFDLTRKSTLNSIKEWYRQGRGFNKTAIPFLVGTKYDHFVNFPREEQEEISNQIFKIVLSKAFDLRCTIPEIEHVGEPLLLYQSVG
ncbi:hypothetical protein LTR04_002374 [Oleoguttula sp. CCFEE 6159]|nr:hypothetical protein LTR04_002374 [Oleoguttula sp. CCFEE 6159]